ncbi:MAG: pseudaminic acid synthase [Granulosicoccus sp.]
MSTVSIAGKCIGMRATAGEDGLKKHPCFIIAEMSANHDNDLNKALQMVDVAADAGVDAIKVQTYSADTLTLPSDHPGTKVDSVWGASNLYELYKGSAMRPELHQPIFERARERGLIAFSSAYDESSVDYLEEFDVPAYKIASFELVHLPLLRHIAQTGKPVILSTGMSCIGEIEEAVDTLVGAGSTDIVLLHCCSAYPTPPVEVNLAAMQTLRSTFDVPVGYSDHTLGVSVAIAAATLGASVLEKHFTLDPTLEGPDHRFSLGPEALCQMVQGVRDAEASLGSERKKTTVSEAVNKQLGRRSLFACAKIDSGETVTAEKIRVVRPGIGLHPRYLEMVIGRTAKREIPQGWPVTWDDV